MTIEEKGLKSLTLLKREKSEQLNNELTMEPISETPEGNLQFTFE